MKGRQDIASELEQISQLMAGMPDKPVFTVPDGYFEQFPEQMLLRVKSLDHAALSAAEEIAGLSPLLAGLDRNMPMKAPEGYFNRDNIVPNPEKEQAPVVSIARRSFRMYAVAASLVAILGFAMLLFRMSATEQAAVGSVNVSAELPKLSEKEMDDFLAAFPDLGASTEPITVASGSIVVEDMISDIDEKGLEEFLSEMPDVKTDKLN